MFARKCRNIIELISEPIRVASSAIFISTRYNIYILRFSYDASVHLSVTEVHWHIIANLGSKFRSNFIAHCGRREGSSQQQHLALC